MTPRKLFIGKKIADSGPVVIKEGETTNVWVEFVNVGTITWDHNTRLGTTNPQDRHSQLYNDLWPFKSRAAQVEREVPPGESYKFCFTIKAPTFGALDIIEDFALVHEFWSWNEDADSKWHLEVKIVAREYSAPREIGKPTLLYLSCHQELEANEITTFRNIGFEVFTVGFYTYESPKTDSTLRVIPGENHPALQARFNYYHQKNFSPGLPLKLSDDFIKQFDIVVNTHFAENLDMNWLRGFNKKFTIHRTIGQGGGDYEKLLGRYFGMGVPFVRICATEHLMAGFCGQTQVIRTSIDDEFFSGWNGHKEQVLTVQKWMTRAGPAIRMLPEYERITNPFDGKRILAGRENGKLPYGLGDVPNDELQQLRQDSRVYFALASRYAPLTYSIVEAMMTGMPVVSVGTGMAGYPWFEPPTFIKNGENGFCAETETDCIAYIKLLMNDIELGKKIGAAGRKTMQQMFSPAMIEEQWRAFFKGYGF